MDKARIKEFVKDRDTAIMEFDLKKFKRFIKNGTILKSFRQMKYWKSQ